MDQLKEFLRQCVKYRFWIVVGVAALFPMIAYFVGSGPIKAKADDRDRRPSRAPTTDVKQYSAPNIPNDQYKPIVDEKTEVLTKDVNKAWKKLYEPPGPAPDLARDGRGAVPQLGPQVARERRPRRRPAGDRRLRRRLPEVRRRGLQDVQAVRLRDGQGDRRRAPPRRPCSGPSAFDPAKPPDSARSGRPRSGSGSSGPLLDVVAKVNKKAKDWDYGHRQADQRCSRSATRAQDQRSIAKGETLDGGPGHHRTRASRRGRAADAGGELAAA